MFQELKQTLKCDGIFNIIVNACKKSIYLKLMK